MKPHLAAEKITSPGHVTVAVLGDMCAASTDRQHIPTGSHDRESVTSLDPFQSPRGSCTVAPVTAPERCSAERTEVEVAMRQTNRQNTAVTIGLTAGNVAVFRPGAPPGAPPTSVAAAPRAEGEASVLVEDVTLVMPSSAKTSAAVPDAGAPACALGQVLSHPRV